MNFVQIIGIVLFIDARKLFETEKVNFSTEHIELRISKIFSAPQTFEVSSKRVVSHFSRRQGKSPPYRYSAA